MEDRGSVFRVLVLGDEHVRHLGKRHEDGASDPRAETRVRVDDLRVGARGRQLFHLPLQALAET